MKSVTITVGDYDILTIQKIFENEKDFEPRDPRDELIIKVLRQIIDNPKIDLGDSFQLGEPKENPYPYEPQENIKFT